MDPLQQNGGGGSESPSSVRRKPNKDVAELYKQQIAKASPPPSPVVTGRARPARDITQLYTGKLEAPVNGAAAGAEKVSPRKVLSDGVLHQSIISDLTNHQVRKTASSLNLCITLHRM